MTDKCYYPTWERQGEVSIGEHHFDRDGYCNICGEKKPEPKQENYTMTDKCCGNCWQERKEEK